MAMSIRGLPEDVKARLERGAKVKGRSLNAHVVDILSRHEEGHSCRKLVECFAGTSTYADMIEARRIENENALDWSMGDDDPSGR